MNNSISIKKNNSIKKKTRTIIKSRRKSLKNLMRNAYAEIRIYLKNVRTLFHSIKSQDEKK
jgi:hypothetical protein